MGPAELWAFSTTAEDANIRNQLYKKIGPLEARKVLSNLFPAGSAMRVVEDRMDKLKENVGVVDEDAQSGIIDQLVNDILEQYRKDPNVKRLA